MTPIGYIIIALLILAAVWIGFTFNRFVRLKNMMREAWSGVEVQLKRRHDLIPLLAASVKTYRDYEAAVLETVTRARAVGQGPGDIAKASQAETDVTQSLRTLLAVAEAYPDLKASGNFQQLNEALVDTENQLQYARRYYNGAVRDYTILSEAFPSVIIARLFRFPPREYFEVESSVERQAPKVELA
ncbi:MAG: LemA family protein [Lentisphaerae bacterium]|jgi:LemA protein|nr:LemA family protein [Lentisphaerota bacterium]